MVTHSTCFLRKILNQLFSRSFTCYWCQQSEQALKGLVYSVLVYVDVSIFINSNVINHAELYQICSVESNSASDGDGSG